MNQTNLSKKHFFDVDDALLDYLEEQDKHIIEMYRQSNEINRKNATTLFTLLLSGSGATFLMLVNSTLLSAYLTHSLSIACIGWLACAIYLAFTCLMTRVNAGYYQDPSLLYSLEFKQYLEKNKNELEKRHLTPLLILRKRTLYQHIEVIALLRKTNQTLSRHLDVAKKIAIMIFPAAMVLPAFFI